MFEQKGNRPTETEKFGARNSTLLMLILKLRLRTVSLPRFAFPTMKYSGLPWIFSGPPPDRTLEGFSAKLLATAARRRARLCPDIPRSSRPALLPLLQRM